MDTKRWLPKVPALKVIRQHPKTRWRYRGVVEIIVYVVNVDHNKDQTIYIHPTCIYILSICPYFANRTPHINFQKSGLFTTKKRWGNGPPLDDQATTSLAFPCKAKTLSKTAPTRMTSSGLFHAQESINLTCPTERINPIVPKLPEVCGNNRCQHLAWNQPGAFLISC